MGIEWKSLKITVLLVFCLVCREAVARQARNAVCCTTTMSISTSEFINGDKSIESPLICSVCNQLLGECSCKKKGGLTVGQRRKRRNAKCMRAELSRWTFTQTTRRHVPRIQISRAIHSWHCMIDKSRRAMPKKNIKKLNSIAKDGHRRRGLVLGHSCHS